MAPQSHGAAVLEVDAGQGEAMTPDELRALLKKIMEMPEHCAAVYAQDYVRAMNLPALIDALEAADAMRHDRPRSYVSYDAARAKVVKPA